MTHPTNTAPGETPHSRPLPPDVPGFEEFRRSGQAPPVPTTPPPLVVRPTALARARILLASACAFIVGGFVVVKVLSHAEAGTGWFLALAAVSIAVMTLLWRAWGRVGDRQAAELMAGYTTLTLTFGGFHLGASRRWGEYGHRPPWDYRGTWVLDGQGNVISAPDPAVIPPGYYPSPTRAGKLELWTGAVWCGEFRSWT